MPPAMSIVDFNTDLCETHVLSAQTHEWLISSALCPALEPHGILLAGLTDAAPGFRFVRSAPRLSQLLVCTAGQGWVWLDGQWVRCESGMAYLTPPNILHAYQAATDTRWEVCWVQSAESWLSPFDAPRLLSVETGPLAAALTGLRREVMDAADSALLPPWAFLVAAYARQMVRPEKGDVRLRRLWEEVGADLGRPWTVEVLAGRVSISGEHLRRLCQRHLGRSPMSHVVSLRMRQAMALLASDFCTIETVAQKVGYDNPFAFSTAFKRYQGISPSEYRFKARGASNSDQIRPPSAKLRNFDG